MTPRAPVEYARWHDGKKVPDVEFAPNRAVSCGRRLMGLEDDLSGWMPLEPAPTARAPLCPLNSGAGGSRGPISSSRCCGYPDPRTLWPRSTATVE